MKTEFTSKVGRLSKLLIMISISILIGVSLGFCTKQVSADWVDCEYFAILVNGKVKICTVYYDWRDVPIVRCD